MVLSVPPVKSSVVLVWFWIVQLVVSGVTCPWRSVVFAWRVMLSPRICSLCTGFVIVVLSCSVMFICCSTLLFRGDVYVVWFSCICISMVVGPTL